MFLKLGIDLRVLNILLITALSKAVSVLLTHWIGIFHQSLRLGLGLELELELREQSH